MKKYFYSDGIAKHGPFTFQELTNQGIQRDTLIWFEGLEEWQPAYQLEQMAPILQLNPPPISNTPTISSEKLETNNLNDEPNLKIASQGWIVVGFIFAVLGGLLGIFMGLNYAIGRYNSKTKKLGSIMFILGIIFFILWSII